MDSSKIGSKSFVNLAGITKQLIDVGLDPDAECIHPELKGNELSNSSVAVFEREIVALLSLLHSEFTANERPKRRTRLDTVEAAVNSLKVLINRQKDKIPMRGKFPHPFD
eukprot:1475073-Pleurochrysis_carterae.AAC.1